jgi:Flp pilus assembly protein TadD
MGKCYELAKELSTAVEFYAKALALEPNNAKIMFKLGWAYLRAGEKEKGLIQMR